MATTNETFEALKVFMVNNYNAKVVAGGREIIKRCHICGDSKDPTSRHMYIGMKNGLIMYNCFKCQAGGIVDGKFLRDLGSFDTSMISMVNQNNQNNTVYSEYAEKKRFLKSSNPILTYRDALETQKKLDYISKRLGKPFTIEDAAKFKIVLNLYDYLDANKINSLTRDKNVCDQIDQFFLGFLSADNAYINMRKLVPDGKLISSVDHRYVNYNIYGLQDNSHKHYIIPTVVNPLNRINIHIAEGAFDILGVYLNTNSNKYNSIFASIGGKSYLGLIKSFILEYGFMNFTLQIYVDNDVDNYEIMKISNLLKPYRIPIVMHRNTFPGEKDYGVPADRIIDSTMRI